MIPEIFNSRTNKKIFKFRAQKQMYRLHKSFKKYIEQNADATLVISRWTF